MTKEWIMTVTEMADKGRFTVEQRVNLFLPEYEVLLQHSHCCAHLGTVGPFTRNTYTGLLDFQQDGSFSELNHHLAGSVHTAQNMILSCTATKFKKINKENCIGICCIQMFYSENLAVQFACD